MTNLKKTDKVDEEVGHSNNKDSLSVLFNNFITLLSPQEKKNFLFTTLLLIIVACFELGSIGLILPFTGLIINPELINTDSRINALYQYSNASSEVQFIGLVAVFLLFIFVVKGIICTYADIKKIELARRFELNLMSRLLKSYLQNNYSFFVKNPPSTLYHNLVGQLPEVTIYLNSLLSLITAISVVIAICALFLSISPFATLILFVGSIFVVGLNVTLVRNALQKASFKIEKYGLKRGRSTLQSLNGMKDLKIFNNEAYFFKRFNFYNERLIESQITQQRIQQIQFRFLEPTALAIVLALLWHFISSAVPTEQYIPVVALFLAGIMRLLPSVAQIVSAINGLRHGMRFINVAQHFLRQSDTYDSKEPLEIKFGDHNLNLHKRLEFNRGIGIDIRSFSYESRTKIVLQDIKMYIQKGKMIGLVGASGCGKTTLIDILLGLYPLTEGVISRDGFALSPEELLFLRHNIGYVPQRVFLYDMSISENVAFGVNSEEVSRERLWEVLEIARLKTFVEQLPEGLETTVGEFGAKLSGGQIQRIGIARALYNNPEILILDEATSALDSQTEHEFNECVMTLRSKMTIIVSAHRMASLKLSDQIFFITDGKITDQGNFDELVQKNPEFSKLVKSQLQ